MGIWLVSGGIIMLCGAIWIAYRASYYGKTVASLALLVVAIIASFLMLGLRSPGHALFFAAGAVLLFGVLIADSLHLWLKGTPP